MKEIHKSKSHRVKKIQVTGCCPAIIVTTHSNCGLLVIVQFFAVFIYYWFVFSLYIVQIIVIIIDLNQQTYFRK